MKELTAEQAARNMLTRMGVYWAQYFTAGELVELANLLAAVRAFTLEDVHFLGSEAWLLLDAGAINERRRRMNDIALRIAALLPEASDAERQ